MEVLNNHNEVQNAPSVEEFLKAFENTELKNKLDEPVRLKIRQETSSSFISKENLPKTDRAAWIIEFKNYPPKGPYSEKDKIPQNYVELEIDTEREEININYAKLTDPKLLGQGIYEQILKIIADKFPNGWKLTSIIDHPRTRLAILGAKEKYDKGEIAEDVFLKEIATSNLIAKTISAGFNNFTFVIAGDDSETIYETARINKDSQELKIVFKQPHE